MNLITNWQDLTPIEKVGDYFIKRDDLFCINGAYGGKARVISKVINDMDKSKSPIVVTCGSRDSRQCEAMARICDKYKIECHIFMPNGKETPVINAIKNIKTATIHHTKVGYNNVVISNAKSWAHNNCAKYIPFGLEFQDAIDINMRQVKNIPPEVKRIIVPCGGGMNMASIIKGIECFLTQDIKVVGIVVGKDPTNTLERFIGSKNTIFSSNTNYELVKSNVEYHQKAKITNFCGIELDDVYEAKCIPFIERGDLLWIVGKRDDL